MPTTTLTGTTQAGSGAHGAVPAAASLTQAQIDALTANLASAGQLTGLSTALGEAAVPGYAGLTAQASKNIGSELAGVISPDVLAQINQQAAERGVNVGTGSPNASAAALRAMGLTSMQLQGQGQTDLTAAMARAPNVSNMLITPEQQLTQQQLANTLASAPDPATAAAANLQALQDALTTGQKQGTAGGYTITGGAAPGAAATAGVGRSPWTAGYPNVPGIGGGGAAVGAGLPTTPTTAPPIGAAEPGYPTGAGLDLSGLGAGFDPSALAGAGDVLGLGAGGAGATSEYPWAAGAQQMSEEEWQNQWGAGSENLYDYDMSSWE